MLIPWIACQSDGSRMYQKDIGTKGRYLRATWHPNFPHHFRFVIEGGRGKTVCEYPWVGASGSLVWEWPERVPEYAKRIAAAFFERAPKVDPSK